jgi:hypothetical protein
MWSGGTESLIESAGAAGWDGVDHADSTGSTDAAMPANNSATSRSTVSVFI